MYSLIRVAAVVGDVMRKVESEQNLSDEHVDHSEEAVLV